MQYIKKVHIIGGGTFSYVRNHLAIATPAFGTTAKALYGLCVKKFDKMEINLHLTKMAGGYSCKSGADGKPNNLVTNDDVSSLVEEMKADSQTRVIFMNTALCDFGGNINEKFNLYGSDPVHGSSGKYADRLQSDSFYSMRLSPSPKIVANIRKERKDIFLVAFKTTCGETEDQMYIAGLDLCKRASCNLVLVNDTVTRMNLIVTPEEARYGVTADREKVLAELVDIAWHRSHLSFTRSTVVKGDPVPWSDARIPSSVRVIVDHLIGNGAYKPFNGATAGHFAIKLDDQTFLTSIRRTDFNDLAKNGMVLVKTDGPDTVLAYGAKPSVGGQSQRIVFADHQGYDSIVHFHCPLLPNHRDNIPVVSQREVECGSHQCGHNTSNGLKQFGNIKAVYLDQHGPNILFNRNIDPREVVEFISANFDLGDKTGGPVSLV